MRFRLHYLEIHAGFTRTFTVPKYELVVAKAAFPTSAPSKSEAMHEVRETPSSAVEEYRRMVGTYGPDPVQRNYAGPESLEAAMQAAAEETAQYERADQERMAKDHARQKAEQEAKAAAEAREQQKKRA